MRAAGKQFALEMMPHLLGMMDGLDVNGSDMSPQQQYVSFDGLLRSALSDVELQSDLPDTQIYGRTFTAEEQIVRLGRRACEDAFFVIKLCDNYRAMAPLPERVSFKSALLNSKQSMLGIALLKDYNALFLKQAINDPFNAPGLIAAQIDTPPVKLGTGKNTERRFEWTSQYANWIQNHEQRPEEGGCPAHRIIVDGTDNKRQPLTYYFWDRLIEYMYTPAPALLYTNSHS